MPNGVATFRPVSQPSHAIGAEPHMCPECDEPIPAKRIRALVTRSALLGPISDREMQSLLADMLCIGCQQARDAGDRYVSEDGETFARCRWVPYGDGVILSAFVVEEA